jgi:uncharacterized protein YggE
VKAIYPLLACIGCAISGMLSASDARAQEGRQENLRTITVTGNAEVRAEPDRAFATFGIENDGRTAQEAQSGANAVIQRVLESLRRLAVPARNVQTSGLTLHPVYEPQPSPTRDDRPRAPRIVAYRASNTLTVLVEDLKQVGPIIDAAMAGGANNITGVRFALADDLPQRLEALRAASAEARRKAEAIATALGVALGPLRSANESYVRILPMEESAYARMAPAAAATPVAAGQITIQATVNVVYDVGAVK